MQTKEMKKKEIIFMNFIWATSPSHTHMYGLQYIGEDHLRVLSCWIHHEEVKSNELYREEELYIILWIRDEYFNPKELISIHETLNSNI